MKREQFLEKLESLLDFKQKNNFRMYSQDLMVTSSEYFFDFSIADGVMRGSVLYGDIMEVSLEEDPDEGLFMHLSWLSGDLYIPASRFDIKTGAIVHTIEPQQIVVLDSEKEKQTSSCQKPIDCPESVEV